MSKGCSVATAPLPLVVEVSENEINNGEEKSRPFEGIL
jgi:hypothetical protein